MTTSLRRRDNLPYLVLVGIILVWFVLLAIAAVLYVPSSESGPGDHPTPVTTKTVTKTIVKKEVKTVPVKCPDVVRRQAEYAKAIDAQAAAAGKLDYAGDDMLYALNTHDLQRITDTTTKYHKVYSNYVTATRDALSSAEALGVAVADCS